MSAIGERSNVAAWRGEPGASLMVMNTQCEGGEGGVVTGLVSGGKREREAQQEFARLLFICVAAGGSGLFQGRGFEVGLHEFL